MSAIYDDAAVIAALYDALAPFVDARHPVSGAPFEAPVTPAGRAALLNAYLYDPEIVFVWSKTMTYAHLAVWRDYVNASSRRFAIVCPSDKNNRRETDRLPTTPFWPADTGFDPLRFLPAAPSCRVLLYPTNDRKNTPFFVQLPSQLHVSTGHGDSDKSSSASRYVLVYDAIIVADRHAIDRFVNADVPVAMDRFLPIGAAVLPKVAFVPQAGRARRILYAPTFEGWQDEGNFSSVERVAPRLRDFAAAGGMLALRGHHAIGTRLPGYKTILGELVAAATRIGTDKAEQFNWSDAILCDVSGILSEYLFTGKPIIIPAARSDTLVRGRIAEAGLDRYCHVWASDEIALDDFLDTLDDAAMRERRLARRGMLYQDAGSFAESLTLFEDAMSYLMASHAYRRARSRQPRHRPSGHVALPDELEAVAARVRSGEIMLRLPLDA